MLKLINIFTVVALSVILFVVIYRFMRDMARYKRRMRKLDEWSQFHQQLNTWASEIVDVTIRQQYMNECIGKLINSRTDDYKEIEQFDWNVEKMKIYRNWGQHIPSLLQEVRDMKLNKLI